MALPTLVNISEQPNLRFAVMAINKAANASATPDKLVDSDVNAKGTLAGLISSLQTRQSTAHPVWFNEYQAIMDWIRYLNFTDAQANNITNVRTSGDAHDLRFTFFNLITDTTSFSDNTNADITVDHPDVFP